MLHFSLRVLPALKPEITAVVSKKVSKKAVLRNIVKRRVRVAARPLLKGLKPGFYVFSARAGAETLSLEEIKAELALVLKKG